MVECIFLKVVAVFILGLIFGSFANVIVDRGESQESMMGRSRCDYCKNKLSWYDNIPLLSYIFLGGVCRQCKKKISWQYPAIEFLFGISFLVITWKMIFFTSLFNFDDIVNITFYLSIGFILLTILVWDLKYMVISDGLIVGGLVFAGIYFSYQYFNSADFLMDVNANLTKNILGGMIVSGFFYAMFRFSNGRWIGGGDVKLGALVGFLVGWRMVYFLLLISYILGVIPALYLLITKKATVKTRIPFGPFLVIATLLVMLFEEELWLLWDKFM